MSKLVDKERLAKLAAALDARAKAAVKAEEERAMAAEQAVAANVATNAAAIAAINNEATGLLKQAKDHAQGLVDGEKELREQQEGVLAGKIEQIEGKLQGAVDNFFEGAESGTKVAQMVADIKANKAKLAGIEEGKTVVAAIEAEKDLREKQEAIFEGRIAANEAFVKAQPEVDSKQNQRLTAIEEMIGLGGVEGDKTALDELQESIDGVQDSVDAVVDRLDAEGGLVDRIEANEANIARLDGAVNVEGSVKKQIKDAIDTVNQAADELADRVEVLEGEMDAAEGKLVGLEKETVQAAIDQAQADAEAKAAELDAELKLELEGKIEDDVKVVADELANQMDVKVNGSLAKQIADEKARMDAFMADADVQQGAVDTLKELQSYINTHGEAAQKMVDDIADNKTAIEAEAAEARKQEGLIRGELANAIAQEVIDRNAAIKVVTDAQAEINEDVEERVAANETFVAAQPAIDAEQNRRIKALEDANKEGGAMAKAVQDAQDAADAAQEAADAAAGAAQAAQADVDAIEKRLDDPNGLVDRLEAVEEFKNRHSHEALQGEIDAAEGRLDALEAFQKAHSHEAMEKGIADNKAAIEKEVEDRDAAIAEALETYSDTEEVKVMLTNVIKSLGLAIEDNKLQLTLGTSDFVIKEVALDIATDADIDAIIAGLD